MTHRTAVKLVSGWILGGYSLSCDFTEVLPVLAAGGRLAHLPEPHAEPVETDFGTVVKLLGKNILIQIYCSFFNIFHVMWANDSNPAADCISKLDE